MMISFIDTINERSKITQITIIISLQSYFYYWYSITHSILECADPGPSWIGSNTGLAYKSSPQVNRYTC